MKTFKRITLAIVLVIILVAIFHFLGFEGVENCGLGLKILGFIGSFTIGWKIGEITCRVIK